MRYELILRIKPLFEAHLEKAGYVLVDIRFYRAQGGALILEVLTDRREGGITLDECAALSRELSGILEEHGLLAERFTLDVSSPGLDRPLVVAGDFLRAKGRKVRVFLREPVEGRTEYEGVVADVTEGEVVLATSLQTTMTLPYMKVHKAKQVIL